MAKLASSHAHIQSEKYGRAMCEVFGAFGWAEGVPMMKQIADHMLVSGINHFVPHAFDIRYPDADCPPHFFIGGRNPQFGHFSKLIRYMKCVSHLLCGGVHQASVAVFYNAEAEWCGGEYTLFQEVSKHLLQHQIDFDFVPADYLKNADVVDGMLCINGEAYSALIVSYSEILPDELIQLFAGLGDRGTEIIFCDGIPSDTCGHTDTHRFADTFTVIETDKLACYLVSQRKYDILPETSCPYLRFYHTVKENTHIYMFTNEDAFNPVDTYISMPQSGKYLMYDPWENTAKKMKTDERGFRLRLAPSEAKIVVFEEYEGTGNTVSGVKEEIKSVDTVWNIYKLINGGSEFVESTSSLYNFAGKEKRFCGILRYETEIETDMIPKAVELGNLGDFAAVYVNGKYCCDALFMPFGVSTEGVWKSGKNKLTVDVYTNLAYREMDSFSRFLPLPPMGMTGPVKLVYRT